MRLTYFPIQEAPFFEMDLEEHRRLNPPRSFLITQANEIIDSTSCGHFTGVFEPRIQKMVPWFKEAADIIDAWTGLVDWRAEGSYGHRTDLTNVVDDDLMGAFYAYGGYRLEAHQCAYWKPEIPDTWELTGKNPKRVQETVEKWLFDNLTTISHCSTQPPKTLLCIVNDPKPYDTLPAKLAEVGKQITAKTAKH